MGLAARENADMERVVITGIGLVTPVGIGTEASWQALLAGKSGVGAITLFDADERFPSRIAAEVSGFDAEHFMPRRKIRECARFITFAWAATKLALENSGLVLTDEVRERAGCFIGVGLGGLEKLEGGKATLDAKGPDKITPYFIPSLIGNLAAGQVSIEFGLRGPAICHSSACSSSGHALGEAAEWIRHGRAEVMVAGGAEATITPLGIGGFCAMFALSRRNAEPTRASRPFDRDRDGFVCGEGAAVLILESLRHAKARGANIIAEISGFGATSDAHHITKPAPDGAGARRCMTAALSDARLSPNEIDYVNAHGTSTPAGDVEESTAMEQVFGDHALSKRLWVSSTKSMMGHLLGASGAAEAAVCALAIRDGVVPPTINLDNPDPGCRLDYVAHVSRERRVRHAVSNSFGFGGTNATLVLSSLDAESEHRG